MSKRKTTSANLENKRNIFLEIGFIGALIVVLIALEWKSYNQIEYNPIYHSSHVDEDILSPIQLKKKEIIPKKPQSYMAINIVPDDAIDDLIDIFDPTDNSEPLGDWTWKEDEPEEDPIEEIIPYYSVEIKPEFPGGETALLQYVANHFRIPKSDLAQGNSGTIYVGFTIDEEGWVRNIKILRAVSEASSEEAIRVVQSLPQWKPGIQLTRKVKVDFVLPIKIKLM